MGEFAGANNNDGLFENSYLAIKPASEPFHVHTRTHIDLPSERERTAY